MNYSSDAIFLTTLLLSIATFLGACELILLREDWSSIWQWGNLRDDYASYPTTLRKLFDFLFLERSFFLIQCLRMVVAVAATLHPNHAILVAGILLGQWLTSIRFRGTLNGGSDTMTMVVAVGLFVVSLSPESFIFKKAGLGYIAIQLTVSYFLAGISKLKTSEWRSGDALPAFVETPGYDRVPEGFRKLISSRARAKGMGYAVIAFECLFPLVWVRPELTVPFLAVAFGFHLLNYWVFGLNRFVFAWVAAYPALLYWRGNLL